MTYRDIVKYVFLEEGQDFDLIPVTRKCRQRELVVTRQICMTLGSWCLNLSNATCAGFFFGQDHATTNNAKIKIQNLRDTDKAFAAKYDRYLKAVRTRITLENAILQIEKTKAGSIASRTFNNTVIQVEVTTSGYMLRSSKIVGNDKVDQEIPMTAEGMRALVDCYCEINSLTLNTHGNKKDYLSDSSLAEQTAL